MGRGDWEGWGGVGNGERGLGGGVVGVGRGDWEGAG